MQGTLAWKGGEVRALAHRLTLTESDDAWYEAHETVTEPLASSTPC